MNKFLLKISNKNMVYPRLNLGYILGMEKYSICFNDTFNINDIKEFIIKNSNCDIFVSLNRVIYEHELNDYKNTLLQLDKLNLKGIIVGDLAAFTYNLKTPLIIDQLHLNNSYLSINHYFNHDNAGCFLSNDITKEEINEIKANTNAILFKQVFGYIHLSSSVRKLITNYLKHFKLKNNSSINYIKEEKSNNYYIIKEEEFGTHILESKVLDLYEELNSINVDYYVIDSYLLEDEIVKNAIYAYVNNDNESLKLLRNKLESTKGFINTKTIYKVKNYE